MATAVTFGLLPALALAHGTLEQATSTLPDKSYGGATFRQTSSPARILDEAIYILLGLWGKPEPAQ